MSLDIEFIYSHKRKYKSFVLILLTIKLHKDLTYNNTRKSHALRIKFIFTNIS